MKKQPGPKAYDIYMYVYIYIYIRPASRSMDVQCFHLPKDETDGTQEKDLPMAV